MNIKEALKNLNHKYKVAKGVHCLTQKGSFVIDIEEYETIKKHTEEQQLEIEAHDRNAGDANELIDKQCKENDKLKEHIEELEEIVISVNRNMSLFRCENGFDNKTFEAIQRKAKEIIK